MIKVIMESGETVQVSPLPMFGLDDVIVYSRPFQAITTGIDGREIKQSYNFPTTPPLKPTAIKDDAEKHTKDWYDWLEYDTYYAALESINQQMVDVHKSCELAKSLLMGQVDKPELIVTDEDYLNVASVAMFKEVAEVDIFEAFERTFGASFNGGSVEDAIKGLEKGKGAFNVTRHWVFRAIRELGIDEDTWSAKPYYERVRMVASIVLPELMDSLEFQAKNKK